MVQIKKISRILVLTTILSIVFAFNAFANTINIPADYTTIQAGINAANNGDTVLVADGSYTGSGNKDLNFGGKPITVKSVNGEENTIIDCQNSGRGFYFHNGEISTSIVDGFTIINGYASYDGGGIYCCWNSNPSLNNVTIKGNSAYYGGGIYCYESNPNLTNVTIKGNSAYYGGGIYCYESNPSLTNVKIIGNSASYYGGGIRCYESNPNLTNVTIKGNSASWDGGGIYCYRSNPSLTNVTITGNSSSYYGGGIYCYSSSPSLTNVTITGNSANDDGGGICCWDDSNPSLVNCILWNDSPQEIYFSQYVDTNTITISYSDIEGDSAGIVTNNHGTVNWLEGNIDEDPLFVDPLNGDYNLSWTNYPIPDSTMSPCIDAGDPSSPPDPDGTIADMGAYYFNQNVSVDDPQEISNYMLTNYPNPISSYINNLTVSFSIHKPGKVKIQLFNIKGQLISTLMDEDKNIGDYTISHPVNDLSSGIYFTKLSVDGVDREIGKVVLLR